MGISQGETDMHTDAKPRSKELEGFIKEFGCQVAAVRADLRQVRNGLIAINILAVATLIATLLDITIG